MKKTLTLLCTLMLSIMCYAQSDIHFSTTKSETKGLSDDVVEALDLKLHQVLNRNSAAAADVYNVFAIMPSLSMSDVLSTEGLVQNVSVAKGELVLIAKNIVDGTEYYTASIPVEADVVGNKEKAMLTLVNNIKVTSPAFTRFIRTTRQKIADYYAANCATILQKAQALYNQRRYQEAICYLSAVTANIPCYDQAYALQQEIAEAMPPAAPDTVVVVKEVEKPIIVEVEKPTVEPQPANPVEPATPVVDQPTPQQPPYELTISVNDLDFRVVRCYGNHVQQRITIETEFCNRRMNEENGDIVLKTAFDENARELELFNYSVTDRGASYDWRNMPPRLTMKQNFYLIKLDHDIPTISYMKLKVRDAIIEIRNLPVEWQ